jgi:hypothetical protein
MKHTHNTDSSKDKSLDEWKIPIRLLDLGMEVAHSDPEIRNLVEELIANTISIGEYILVKERGGEVMEDSAIPAYGESISLKTFRLGLMSGDSEMRAMVEDWLAEILKAGFLRVIKGEVAEVHDSDTKADNSS